MLIQNWQQLFWRNPWLLWSLHPTECPNFDTERHGCSYLYILWENRFPPCNRLYPPPFFFFSFFFSTEAIPCHRIESELAYYQKNPSCVQWPYMLLFYVVIFTVMVRPRWLRYSKVPGSQSESPSQCISYNSHSLLILPLKFMLPLIETPYCGPCCLPYRRVMVTQECWTRCWVIPSDVPPLPKATSIAAIGQSTELIDIPHTKPESLALPTFLLAFFSISYSYCKSRDQMLRGIKIEGTTGDDEERGNRK